MSDQFPAAVLAYLQSVAIERRQPAYLLINNEGRLLDWGGHVEAYKLGPLHKEEEIAERLDFLAGLLPLKGAALILPFIKTASGLMADVHLFAGAQGDWVLLLDATEDARQRQLVQQKGNELRLNYQRLLKEMQKKEILLHCIVHDLAGPLMGIRGGFELLAKENLSPQGRKFLDLGLRQTLKQDGLIREILRAFAAEVEAFEAFSVDPHSAPDVLVTAREMLEALSPAGALNQVKLQLAPDLDVHNDWRVVGEKSRLERVLSNLIENALRHSPAHTTVTLGCHQEDDQVLTTIDDEGPGIPPEIAGQLFQKFAQGKSGRGKIGLGLYFCRITVEHWGGQIGHTPRAGGGTRFWFRLPRPRGS